MDAETSTSMKQFFIELLCNIQIKLLLVFTPATLFQKISQLDWYSRTLHDWIDLHTSDKNLRILDAGCATGYLSEYLHRSGQQVTGIDASAAMIKTATHSNPEIDFRLADANQLPFEDNTFDIVSSASLVNIVPEPGELIKQMARVCKQGGWLTFLFPVAGFNEEDLRQCIAILGLSGFSKVALVTWHRSAPKISVRKVNNYLEHSGLRPSKPEFYLHGMLASVSARKDF